MLFHLMLTTGTLGKSKGEYTVRGCFRVCDKDCLCILYGDKYLL